jgi:hypothetical protein
MLHLATAGALFGCSAVGPRAPGSPIPAPSASASSAFASELEEATTRWVSQPSPELERALRRALENAATREVLLLLDHADVSVRQAAVRFLVETRPGSWLELGPRLLARPDLGQAAVAGFCEHAEKPAASGPNPDPSVFLLELARGTADAETRGQALGCLAIRHPDQARALALEWIDRKDQTLTRHAVLALGRSNAWYEVGRLVRLAKGADTELGRAAVEALGRITNPPAAEALLELARASPDDELRGLAWAAWLRHPERRTGALSPSETKRTLGPLVTSVLRALRQRNMDALARLVHPDRGVRFGLCGKFIPSSVYPAQVRGLLRDDAPKSWGGSCRSDDRELAFDDYLDRLTGFEDAPIVGYDVWLGATPKDKQQLPADEVERAFPDGAFVELSLPEGRDGQTPGETLILVFAHAAAGYKLVGILQAQTVTPEPAVHGPLPPPEIKPDW